MNPAEPLPLCRSIALLVAVLTLHPLANGATYTWDSDLVTPGAQDGGGTWDGVTSNWLSVTTNVPWGNGNDAVFGAGTDGSYAVTVAIDPSPSSLIFNKSGYTLSAAIPHTITFTNAVSGLVIAAGKTATVGNNVTFSTPVANQTTSMTGGGTLIIENGGTLKNAGTANSNRLDINSTTVEVRTGGSLLTAPVPLSQNGNAIFVNGTLNVLGGTVNAVGTIGIGQSSAAGTSAGTLTLSSGTVLATSTNGIRFGATSGTTPGGTVNLDGGGLTAAIIFKGAGTVANSIMNFNGGTLLPSVTSATFMQGLSRANVRDGGAIIDTNGRDLTIGQALLHSNIGGDSATDGGLTKNGAGRLLLNGANTYTGGTTINAGLVEFGLGATPASGGIAIKNAGALSATGAFVTISEWLNSGLISTASTGAIALTTDSFEGINLNAYPNLMLGASAPSGYFGTLTPAANTYRLGGGGSTLTLFNTNALTGANDVVIGAPGSTGTVILSNTNDYTGSTTINSGALQIDAPAGPGGTITIHSPGSLNVSSATQWLDTGRIAPSSDGVLALTSDNFENIDLTGRPDLVLGAAPAAIVFGTITPGGAAYRLGGSGTLTLFNANALTGAHDVIIGTGASPGTVILSNANDYTGATTINPGSTLQIGDGGSDGAIASSSAIVNNGALVFNPASVQEFAQSISGSGTLSKQGAGTLILNGANSHTGATILAGGILRLANSDALGDSPFSATNGNVRLELSGGITVTNPIRLVGSGLNLGGVLGSVDGENTLTDFGLGGNGGTRISVSAGSKLNLPNPIALSPGVTVQNFRIIGAGTAFLGADNSAAIGAANLFLLGLGTEAGPTVEIGNDRAFGLGTIDFQPLSNSTLQSSGATPRTIANALRFSDASLNQAAFGAPGTGDLTFTGAATLLGDLELFVNNDETEFTGAFSGAGRSVTKLGDGLLTLSGPQDYDTLTTAAGTTELDAALGSGTSTLNANAATNIGASQTLAALNIGAGAIVTLTAAAPGPLVQAIPEPATTVTLLAGLATWLGSRRRRDRTGGKREDSIARAKAVEQPA